MEQKVLTSAIATCLVVALATLTLTAKSSMTLSDLSQASKLFCQAVHFENYVPIPEPDVTWYQNTPDFINTTMMLYTGKPLYMMKAFETVMPDYCGEAYILLSHERARQVFQLNGCVNGASAYRKFLTMNIHEYPMQLTVSFSRNRKM